MSERGVLVILTGPGGVGKDSVIKKATEMSSHTVIAVSHTTRSPREGEIDGVHYHFVSAEEFQAKVARQEMLEWVSYPPPINGVLSLNSKFYGVEKGPIDIELNKGNDVLLILDVAGAQHVRPLRPDSVSIFICPPGNLNSFGEPEVDLKELENRLRKRGDSKEQIKVRLELAPEEIKAAKEYDHILFNRKIEDSAIEVLNIAAIQRKRILEEVGL